MHLDYNSSDFFSSSPVSLSSCPFLFAAQLLLPPKYSYLQQLLLPLPLPFSCLLPDQILTSCIYLLLDLFIASAGSGTWWLG
jgi:hypothetical protein